MLDYLKKLRWYYKNKDKVIYTDGSRSNWFKMLGLGIHNNTLCIKYITGMYGYVDSTCVNTRYLHNKQGYYIYKYYAVNDIEIDMEDIS